MSKCLKTQCVYLILTLTNTLAASFIWGINTLFLLDAGLTNFQAFFANALFTAGMVLFEIPTGVVADSWGRRKSYMLGSITLALSTILYYAAWYTKAPFLFWALTSMLLGLGFTFFSGATEAWLVDALKFQKFKGNLESVFAKGQIVSGIAMLSGSVAGGLIAQATNLGFPYIVRFVVLLVNFAIAFWFMKDLGFTPEKRSLMKGMKSLLTSSLKYGLKNPPVRWLMLAAPFTGGVGIFVFYAMQPYMLELFGNSEAYWIAGVAAATVAGAQIIGGIAVPFIRSAFSRRTHILILGVAINLGLIIGIGVTTNFYFALGLLVLWALVFAASTPIRQALLNSLIPSKQRATVLSFDSLIGSTGGVITQPALGRVADVWSYSIAFIVAATIQVLALPFLLLAKKENTPTDIIDT